MKTIICVILLTTISGSLSAAEIASIRLSEVESLIEEVVLNRPANHALRDEYVSLKQKEKESQNAVMEAARNGEGFNPLEMAGAMTAMMDVKEKVSDLVAGELLLIIKSELGDTYDIVINEGYGESILYVKGEVADVTPAVRQYLLERKALKGRTE